MQDFTKATLYMADGNTDKKWYVYYFVRNPNSGKMEMKKRMQGINRIKDRRKRIAFGNKLIKNINELLSGGKLNHFKSKEAGLTLIEHLQAEYTRMEGRSKAEKPTLTHETCIVYKSAINIFIGWMRKNNYDHLLPMQFTKQHAIAYSDYMIQEKKYSGVTYNARKIYLGTFFNALIDREIISVNYFEKLKPLSETQARIIPFTDEEIEKITMHLIKINKHGLLRFFRFYLFLLMRGKEITLIQLHDIVDYGVVLIYGDKGKTKLRRAPTIPLFLMRELKKIKNKYPSEYFLFGKGLEPGEVNIKIARVRRLFRKYVKEDLGINKNIYWGKHTGVTKAVLAGKSLRAIQRQGGWKTEGQLTTYLIERGLIINEEFKNMK